MYISVSRKEMILKKYEEVLSNPSITNLTPLYSSFKDIVDQVIFVVVENVIKEKLGCTNYKEAKERLTESALKEYKIHSILTSLNLTMNDLYDKRTINDLINLIYLRKPHEWMFDDYMDFLNKGTKLRKSFWTQNVSSEIVFKKALDMAISELEIDKNDKEAIVELFYNRKEEFEIMFKKYGILKYYAEIYTIAEELIDYVYGIERNEIVKILDNLSITSKTATRIRNRLSISA